MFHGSSQVLPVMRQNTREFNPSIVFGLWQFIGNSLSNQLGSAPTWGGSGTASGDSFLIGDTQTGSTSPAKTDRKVTCCIKIKPPPLNGGYNLAAQRNSYVTVYFYNSYVYFNMAGDLTGAFPAAIGVPSVGDVTFIPANPFVPNAFNYLILRLDRDAGFLEVFGNSTRIATYTDSRFGNASAFPAIQVLMQSNFAAFAGQTLTIDDISFYTDLLSDASIAKLAAGKIPTAGGVFV